MIEKGIKDLCETELLHGLVTRVIHSEGVNTYKVKD